MTLQKTLAAPVFALALFMVAGTALAKDDASSQKHRVSSGEPTVSISGNGSVLVRGATVTSVVSGSVTAKTSWDDSALTWTIDTDSDTNYVDAGGDSSSRGELSEGDTISFAGTLDGSLSVDAHTIRNWSKDSDDDRTSLTGTVTSVASGSFVIDAGNRRITIDVDSDTDFLIGKNDANFDDIDVGSKVRVSGAYEGDEFAADSVTAIAVKSEDKRPWHSFLNIWSEFKGKWNK